MNYLVRDEGFQRYAADYQITPLLAKVLAFFDLDDAQVKQLLNPYAPPEISADPNLIKAKNRLLQAKAAQEKVMVYGDYDADGICATTLAVSLLRRLGITCGYYIPNRLRDGYGFNAAIVDDIHNKGYALIMTVDNGVSATEAISRAQSLGIDVLVCDHHIIPEGADFSYLLHPSLFDPAYRKLCGTGVVLQLARCLNLDDDTAWILAMVATIGDMVELFDANRYIVKEGLRRLRATNYRPVTALLKPGDQLDEEAIAFRVVPALNSLGRLADEANANILIEYLLLQDPVTIANTAAQIKALNQRRRKLVSAADMACEEHYVLPNYEIFISDDYHEGIIGLLANRMVHQLQKPVLVGTRNDGDVKFSGRSVHGFDIHQDLEQYAELFTSFGGHKQACGLTIAQNRLPELLEQLAAAASKISGASCVDVIELELADLRLDEVRELDRLRPYGVGLPRPLFALNDLAVDGFRMIKDKYPKATVINGTEKIEIISFRTDLPPLVNDQRLTGVVGRLTINEFHGRQSINFVVEDVMCFNSPSGLL